MKIRAVFLACFAIACLPAIGWSTWVAASAWSAWTNAAIAVHAAKAMGDALHLVEALSVERGALQERALSPVPGVEDLASIAASNDALLARARSSMFTAGLPDEAVTYARDLLVSARLQVAEAVTRPPAERDPDLVPKLMALLYERLDAVEAAVAMAERQAARASASVGALVAVGSTAVEMRAIAGRRSSHLSRWIGGRSISPEEASEAKYLTGHLSGAWQRLQRQVQVLGEPPRLAAAVAATRTGFFTRAEPRYREFVEIAHAGGERPMNLPDWRRWTIAALPGLLEARDAAIEEALEQGRTLAAIAQARLAVAVSAALAVLVLAVASVLVLLRRLVLPIQRLTGAVSLIAAGDTKTPIPDRGRGDEIGAMAAAIEVFKENASRVQSSREELLRANLHLDAALGNMSQGLCLYDRSERLILANERFCNMTGLGPGSARHGMHLRDVLRLAIGAGIFPARKLEEIYAKRRAVIDRREPCSFVEEYAGDRTISISFEPMANGGWVFTFEDITARRQAEERIAYMAHHDALTGLPNRVLLQQRLDEASLRVRQGESFAVYCLDLDRFKEVNDTLGHSAGDELLRAVAMRLQAAVREAGMVARLGGDEFAIVQAGIRHVEDAGAVAERLVEELGRPYDICGQQVVVGVSVGVTLAPADGTEPGQLLKNADMALYIAKAEGRGRWRFFEAQMGVQMKARRALELDLRDALTAGELDIFYQPVMDLRRRVILGFEALLRWRHPERGMVSPSEFVPLAEEIGLIAPIGAWVLRRACADAATWPTDLSVAVNLSPAQFRGGELLEEVTSALRCSGLDPSRLELEITETAILRDTGATISTLQELKALGLSIALDDFGVGYSSLSYLRKFSFDRVKIDRSFVAGLGKCADSTAIVRAVIGLCDNLGMEITAEGVETEDQRRLLLSEGCGTAQGYLFSPARPAAEVSALLAAFGAGAPQAEALHLARVDPMEARAR